MTNQLVSDVDKLLSMFEMKAYDLFNMSNEDINALELKIVTQTGDVCQGEIDPDYIKTVIRQAGHIITLTVNNLIIGMSILTEKTVTETRYMEVEILCSRKFAGTGRQMLLASENLARSMIIKYMSLSSLPVSIGFYRKMGYLPIPVTHACHQSQQIHLDIVNVYDHARHLLYLQNPLMTNNTMREEDLTPARKFLLNTGLDTTQYRYLLKEYPEIVDGWNVLLQSINVDQLFEDGNLMMTKCLWDHPTGDIGVINVSSKRSRTDE